MNCKWKHDDGWCYCERAGCTNRVKSSKPETCKAVCNCLPCEYLGDAIQTDGVAVKVKCNCQTAGYRDEYHTVYTCQAPKNQRRGQPGRCLPTMRKEFDIDHQLEAMLYRLCYSCELRNEPCHA